MRQGMVRRVTVIAALATAALVAFPVAAPAAKAGPKGLVAFASNRDGDYDIYLLNQDGSTPLTNLTLFDNDDQYDPAWSPDGKRILFTTETGPGNDQEVGIVNVDGSGLAPVTNNEVIDDQNGVFSPDGKRIAFASDAAAAPGPFDVYVMNADGTSPTRLTFAANAASQNFSPDWSPDGRKITFVSERDGAGNDRDVFVMNADGSGQTQLTFNAIQDRAPKFSPDGGRIIWSSGSPDVNAEIYTMPSTGGPATRLTFNTVRDRAAAFSRDGLGRVFFVRPAAPLEDEIYVMNGDGSGSTLFASSAAGDLAPAPQPAAKCGKKVATIIGTSAKETLRGGPGPDVFSAGGGKDKIKGLGGKDTICGDAGKDQISGGKGKDRCVGGKGDDTASACETERKIP